jgi:hypothetical protein
MIPGSVVLTNEIPQQNPSESTATVDCFDHEETTRGAALGYAWRTRMVGNREATEAMVHES